MLKDSDLLLKSEFVPMSRRETLPDSAAQSDACSTGDHMVASSRLRSDPILSLRLIMKSFLRSFSPFRLFKKGSCRLLAKEYALSTG